MNIWVHQKSYLTTTTKNLHLLSNKIWQQQTRAFLSSYCKALCNYYSSGEPVEAGILKEWRKWEQIDTEEGNNRALGGWDCADKWCLLSISRAATHTDFSRDQYRSLNAKVTRINIPARDIKYYCTETNTGLVWKQASSLFL